MLVLHLFSRRLYTNSILNIPIRKLHATQRLLPSSHRHSKPYIQHPLLHPPHLLILVVCKSADCEVYELVDMTDFALSGCGLCGLVGVCGLRGL